jgi:transcriptional regulator with XRE-family HTH domain
MNNIRSLREERGIRQEDLGKALFLGSSAISALENGKRVLTEDVIIRLCNYFNVSADYLLGRSRIRKNTPDISEEELEMVAAYRRADSRTQGIVDLALSAFPPESAEPQPLRNK